jgi:hypothetical protein
MAKPPKAIKDHEALQGQRDKIRDELHAVSAALDGMETKKAALTQALGLADRKVALAKLNNPLDRLNRGK